MEEDDFSVSSYLSNITQMTISISSCIIAKQIIPSLILIYSCIDMLGYLNMPKSKEKNGRKDFIEWAETYLRPNMKEQNWNGIDLFGARCGLLHTLTYESELLKNGKIKMISYAWGNHKSSGLTKIYNDKNIDSIVIHVDDLYHGLLAGIQAFMKESSLDFDRFETILNRTKKMFSNIEVPIGVKEVIENDK